jgi:hypothetical protein
MKINELYGDLIAKFHIMALVFANIFLLVAYYSRSIPEIFVLLGC